MKKILKKLLFFVLIIPVAIISVACSNNGLSAYDIAVKNGFVGTEAEWLESLKGDKGDAGANGADGTNGSNSFSSYDVWKSAFDNGETNLSYVEWVKLNFDIVIDAETYTINKNIMSVVEVKSFKSQEDLSYNTNEKSIGSGIVYKFAEDGDVYVVTNYHLTYSKDLDKNAYPYYRIKFFRQDNFHYMPASFVGGSSTYDISILKIESDDFINEANASPVSFSTTPVALGASVFAIGNTNSQGINISKGVVDVESEIVDITVAGKSKQHRVIRHDAYISGGNSGGGLFDVNGNLVGITNGGQKDNDRINYAIPADLVQKVANQIIENFEADNSNYQLKVANLGITNFLFDTFSSYNNQTGLVEVIERFRVSTIAETSVFYNKLLAKDIFVSAKVNGREIVLSREYLFDEMMIELKANDELTLKVQRDGEAEPIEFIATITTDLFEIVD